MAESRPNGGITTAAIVAIWLARLVRPRTVPTLTPMSSVRSMRSRKPPSLSANRSSP